MENKSESIIPSAAAPFLTQLAAECGSAANYVDSGVHPSLPNYIVATSGGDQGVDDDSGPQAHPLTVDNIFRQARAARKTSRSYIEAMPSPCATKGTNRYAVKHNPAVYYVGADDRDACLRDDVPFGQLAPDLAAGNLANFVSITPDVCNDMHDCPVAQGDQWLGLVVPMILSSGTYREGRTAVFIVWDESRGAGRMPFVAIAPRVPTGTVADTELGHPSLLAFTEDALGLPRLGAAVGAPDLGAAFGL